MAAHHLIYRHSPERPFGATGLLRWQRYDLAAGHQHFHNEGDGQVSMLARDAVKDAVARGVDVTISWGAADPLVTPAGELLAMLGACQPATIICPERPGKDMWCSISAGAVSPLAAANVQREVICHVEVEYPVWSHGLSWAASAFMVRNSTSAEELGFVEPR